MCYDIYGLLSQNPNQAIPLRFLNPNIHNLTNQLFWPVEMCACQIGRAAEELPDHWERLDAFEGSDYRRIEIDVRLESGEIQCAMIYAVGRYN